MDQKTRIIGIIILVIAVAGGVFWYWQKQKAAPNTSLGVSQADFQKFGSNLGGEVFQRTTTNPIANKLPETNPFKAGTNPLKAQYINPFQ